IGNIKQEETRIDGIDGEIRKTRSKMGKIKSLGPSAPCPTCERVLGDHYQRLIDKFEREILENNEAKRKLEETLDGYRKEKERFERLKEALLKKKDHLSELKEKESSAFALLQAVKKEFEKERQEKEEKEKEFLSIKTISFDERVFHEMEERMRWCYNKYKESVKEVERKQKELHAAESELKDLEGDLRLIGQSIQEIGERIKEQEEMEKRVEEEKKKLLNLNLLEKVMQAFRTDMISRVRPTISTYASILLETLTEGKYSELELNENYDILMYDGGSPYEINRFSGGEEDLANLCIRLAVSEMLTDRAGGEFNLIILDEVFGSQDVNRRRNILSALNLLSNKFRQIFLITHIEEIKQFVTNAILVYEVENGTSRVEME
ncbi:MAG TPA: SMC family ATPase, partial [Thermoplasmatales archaeon]|nr:SMC family ATPase [Thermoplasmatales archaeon]